VTGESSPDALTLQAASAEAMIAREREELARRYESLLAAYQPALARMAASYEWAPHKREDLLQEILLAIWKALPKFRGDCSERTFVFRIAQNRCLTHIWQRGRDPQTADDPPDLEDPRSDPEAQVIALREQGRLQDAIRSLPIAYRQVLTLTLEDLSQAEIAAVLGITENNAAVRLNRARNALRKVLGGPR
jgi:RNA polymerase sigma-70 factor (ECF subfamily)